LHEHRNPAQVFHRIVEEKDPRAEGGKFREADPIIENIGHREHNPEGGHGFDQRLHDVRTPAHTHTIPALRVAGLRELGGLVILPRETFDYADAREGFLQNHRHLRRLAFLGLTSLPHLPTEDDYRDDADWKKNERCEAKFPIDHNKDRDAGKDSDWVFNEIPGNCC
jgi:hypothetical protein